MSKRAKKRYVCTACAEDKTSPGYPGTDIVGDGDGYGDASGRFYCNGCGDDASIEELVEAGPVRGCSKPRKAIGYRVRNSDGCSNEDGGYVEQVYVPNAGSPRTALVLKAGTKHLLRRSDALRLLADWLDCGFEGRIVRVVKERS